MRMIRVALAQINTTVGDLRANTRKIIAYIDDARAKGASLVAFPELAIPGYPPEDLLLKSQFIADNIACLHEVAAHAHGLTVIVGFVDSSDDTYNAAAVLHNGAVAGIYHKSYLPNYSVFDENRYFQQGVTAPVFVIDGVTVGITICEDFWYPGGPAEAQALLGGAELLVNISASPYYMGKGLARERMLSTRAADNAAIVAYCNLVGGQDELVFDGHSLAFDAQGRLAAAGRQFAEDLLLADLDLDDVFRARLHDPRRRKEKLTALLRGTGQGILPPVQKIALPPTAEPPSPPARPPDATHFQSASHLSRLEEVYAALCLGTRDYVRKNGFSQAVIGLSGGVDSALVTAIAADALGPENVAGVFMPSRYSSADSREDAELLAKNLGVRFLVIPIEQTFNAYLEMLAEPFAGREPDVTEENLQARIRGNILMALSNKFGWLVLTTGNKSEMSVGYATLYGDMAGGFAVIKDVPKMLVYELAHHRNREKGVIPQRVLEKAPTAELRPNQKDTDSLPPYEDLDPILQVYVEEDRSLAEIVAMGAPEERVRRVAAMVDRAEYKRRQAPPGVKITPRAFGKDRRLPITNRYREGPVAPPE
jgi:NAD+ synthase (glutamine-hydrolysing)